MRIVLFCFYFVVCAMLLVGWLFFISFAAFETLSCQCVYISCVHVSLVVCKLTQLTVQFTLKTHHNNEMNTN